MVSKAQQSVFFSLEIRRPGAITYQLLMFLRIAGQTRVGGPALSARPRMRFPLELWKMTSLLARDCQNELRGKRGLFLSLLAIGLRLSGRRECNPTPALPAMLDARSWIAMEGRDGLNIITLLYASPWESHPLSETWPRCSAISSGTGEKKKFHCQTVVTLLCPRCCLMPISLRTTVGVTNGPTRSSWMCVDGTAVSSTSGISISSSSVSKEDRAPCRGSRETWFLMARFPRHAAMPKPSRHSAEAWFPDLEGGEEHTARHSGVLIQSAWEIEGRGMSTDSHDVVRSSCTVPVSRDPGREEPDEPPFVAVGSPVPAAAEATAIPDCLMKGLMSRENF
ncbi:hypothetical protein VTK26DRAFT_2651 [Humicola hyalothermophila]